MDDDVDSKWQLVDQTDFDNQNNDSHNQATHSTKRSNSVCSFCSSSFATFDAFRNHLLLCGNKTDRCPKCQRFIRRGIFAYHYDNNCADPDNFDDTFLLGIDINDSLEPTSTSYHDRSTIQTEFNSNYESFDPYLLRRTTQVEEFESTNNVNFATTSRMLHCDICKDNEWFNEKELADHKKSYHPGGPRARHNTSNLSRMNNSIVVPIGCLEHNNDVVIIPCEYCNEKCPSDEFNIHEMSCAKNPRNIEYVRTRNRIMYSS